MDAGEGFAEIVERNAIRGGVSAAGAQGHANGAGEGDPKAAADFLRRAGADREGERAVIVGEEGGVDGVQTLLMLAGHALRHVEQIRGLREEQRAG